MADLSQAEYLHKESGSSAEHTSTKRLILRRCHLAPPQARRVHDVFSGDPPDRHHQFGAKPV